MNQRRSTYSILEENDPQLMLLRLDQKITKTLQQIDRTFNESHNHVSNQMLPTLDSIDKTINDIKSFTKGWEAFFQFLEHNPVPQKNTSPLEENGKGDLEQDEFVVPPSPKRSTNREPIQDREDAVDTTFQETPASNSTSTDLNMDRSKQEISLSTFHTYSN